MAVISVGRSSPHWLCMWGGPRQACFDCGHMPVARTQMLPSVRMPGCTIRVLLGVKYSHP
eukprot:366400-Chlamydomonas_euryale.AAC.14